MSVRILPDALVNQIAAGEVVERPASVVKELVDNALDAEATRVEVQLRSGGRALIRVVDDGVGMDRHDAMMCIERHATSKIGSLDDLLQVRSLGFRGEALPSIASVSRFTLLTRPADREVGTRLAVEGGELRKVADAGCALGTEIDVRSLFFNVPARRKFLRTAHTEYGHCVEAVIRAALARPDVRFEVKHDDRVTLRAPRVATRLDRAGDLLGEHGRKLIPVRFADLGFEIDALVSPVGVHKSTVTGSQYLFVNGRFVRDRMIRRGVYEAYRGIVPKGRYPVVILDVRCDPGAVDVNVHPQKTEVRFHDPRGLVQSIAVGLREGLEGEGIHRPVLTHPVEAPLPQRVPRPALVLPFDPSPPMAAEDGPPRSRVPAMPPSLAPLQQPDPALPPAQSPAQSPAQPPAAVASTRSRDKLLPVPRYRDLTVIGQLAQTYLVCEGGGELVLIDQHAAHERVVLHRLRQQRRERIGTSQVLLTPAVVSLPESKAAALLDRLDVLGTAGLEAHAFAPGQIAVTAVPALLAEVDVIALVRDLADEVAEGRQRSIDDLVEHILATMACHNAVRARDPLTHTQMRALLASLDEVDVSVCAHGRPVAVGISVAELERRFHRT